MGRWSYSSRQEADSLKKIQIWWLKKYGYLDNGWKSGMIKWTNNWSGKETSVSIQVNIFENDNYVQLFYTRTNSNDEKKDFDYKIPLITTPCYFGGQRFWFICPWYTNGKYCGRKVGVLYLGGDVFACRHCYNLTYESRNLSGIWKSFGNVISVPELENMEKKIKRETYKGKLTRKYNNFLKKKEKSLRQMVMVAYGLKTIKNA